MISVIADPTLAYPPRDSHFAPSERFPEYRFDEIAREPNRVYAAVRACLVQAGLDRERFGTPEWNPLGQFIRPGQKVFVLCNFVLHRREHESQADFDSKCTHGSVVRALLDYLLIAVGPSGSIGFGNSPLQQTNWQAVTDETGARLVADYYQTVGAPVELKDLRLFVAERGALGSTSVVERRDESAGGVSVDLGRDSLLEGLDNVAAARFRVSDYNPDRTDAYHACGSHHYVLNRSVADADVIVSLPKLKTHEKVGITCAVKGCVGAIGHKDCLAHHRFGPSGKGGDEYPRDPFGMLRVLSRFHDSVQRTRPESSSGSLLRVVDKVARGVTRRIVPEIGGAWSGNDTAWRMSVDIARAICYTHAGRLTCDRVKPHLALIDGVIGGEGKGPLRPTAVPSGVLLWSDNPVAADVGAAWLMGYDPMRLAIVREALRLEKYPLIAEAVDTAICNGRSMSVRELREVTGRRYEPPPGWRDAL